MSSQDPFSTTVSDLCSEALHESGAIGVGQQALAEDINAAWARMQWMLQQWERKRWLVFHLVTRVVQSTGAQAYSFGPGGDIDTGPGSVRPAKLDSCFVRQITQSAPNQVDYYMEILGAMEDYNRITLKSLVAGPGEAAFLDTSWPLAKLYVWPIPQANRYEIHATTREQLPASFPNIGSTIILPFEYYSAILYNLAIRLRPRYRLGSYPGDPLPALAKDATACLRNSDTQIAKLRMPQTLRRRGLYNIFSDRPY